VYITSGSVMISLTVGIALYATVLMAKTIGGILPIAAKMIHMDPAIMAAPLITTIVDAFSLLLYFGIAKRLLNI
jgi:magnesium transporter